MMGKCDQILQCLDKAEAGEDDADADGAAAGAGAGEAAADSTAADKSKEDIVADSDDE